MTFSPSAFTFLRKVCLECLSISCLIASCSVDRTGRGRDTEQEHDGSTSPPGRLPDNEAAPGLAHHHQAVERAVSSRDAMNFILYSDINERSIGHNLGRPEYSYYFVLKAYRPILESLGQVHLVQSTDEVDPLYRQLHEQGEDLPVPLLHPAAQGGAGPAMPDAVRGRLGVRVDSRRGVGRRSGAGLEPGPGRPWRSHHPLRADCPRGSPGAGRRFSGAGAADADLGGLRRDPPARRTESGQVRRDPATQGLRHRQPPAGPFRRRSHRTDQGRDRGRDPRGPPRDVRRARARAAP